MPGVLTGFTVIAAVIGVGYLLGRLGVLGREATVVLSRVAFFVATPALLFGTVARADLRTVVSSALVVTVVATTVVAAVFVLVARLVWRRPAAETTIGALASSYVNAANIGIPVAVYVLGDASFIAPVLMFQLVVMAPIAFAVLDTATRGRRSLAGAVAQPLANPITVACVLGLAVNLTGWFPPEPVLRPVELVAAMAVPAALLAYGLSLHDAPRPGSGDTRRDVWLAVALKAVVQPTVAYLVARFALGLPDPVVLACTVTAALPTAQNVFVHAVRYDRGVVLARDAVLLSTVAAVPVLIGVAVLGS
ncbi:AEC family transporter [Micromonospora sp. NBC_01655]|uniref:AEC family transporter n=1 Tax=Micromonospora sp. NBC_01655 TaxID=2975983 RepID=UPI0022547815|nr:AEC family transporter [Micromonospora sp. NBC_01655]MCX4474101.1 AEC family transporter [Micromonospora sp. NBC_01655]